jgi:hypothetical protein
MLARGVADQKRTHAFSRYSLIGALSMAVGTLAAAFPDVLTHQGIGRIDAFRLMFYTYAVLGLASAALYRRLPHARMAEPKRVRRPIADGALVVREVRPLGLGSERILLLGGHPERLLLPHRGAIGDPFWSRQQPFIMAQMDLRF